MSPGLRLSRLLKLARTRPVAAALELATLISCVLLFVFTFVALASGPPAGAGDLWLAIIAGGASVAVLWTVLVPAYELLR
jgi:hypothetical protein